MILKELIQRVQALYSKGVPSDDSRLSSRHIYSVLKTNRAKLLIQKSNKKQFINSTNYTVLPCVELIQVENNECDCLDFHGCKILRTKEKLPLPLAGLSANLIKSITSIDGSIVFKETSFEKKKYVKGNKYAKNKYRYYIRDNYLYATVDTGIRYLSVEYLVDDPIEASNFKNACEENCEDCQDCTSYLDRDFPIEGGLVDSLVKLSTEELINVFNTQKEDLTNNTKDNINQESK